MFGHKAGPSIVYEYGCRAPTAGGAVFDQQIRLAHQYRNKLVEIERTRRAAVRPLLDSVAAVEVAEVGRLDAELETLVEEGRQERKAKRGRVVNVARQQRIVELRPQLKAARAAAKDAKQAGRESVGPALAEIDEAARQAVRDARAASGLYWGTYLAVEQGMERARRGNDPQFRRFDGSGRIAVQLQNGLAVAGVFGDDRRLQFGPVPEAAYLHPSRGERRRLCRTVARVRGGSDDGAPVWVEVPVSIHRPLPADGAVKWAYLVRDRLGTKWRHRLQLVVELPAPPDRQLGEGTVALDIGWRLVDDGLRVAYWRDDQAREGSLVLDGRLLAAFSQGEGLQAIRDDNLNVARASLALWLALPRKDGLPEWLTVATSTLAQWRSAARLAALVLRWREQRFDGDDESYDRIEAWRRQDKHLLEWQANLRARALARRRDVYRVFVADLRRRYRTVVIEDFDLRDVAKRVDANGEPTELHEAARRNRQIAALSELRGVLAHSGLEVRKVPAAWTTQTCHACGRREEFDAAEELIHTCRQCGATWDQDQCAASNMLALECGQLLPAKAGSLRLACRSKLTR